MHTYTTVMKICTHFGKYKRPVGTCELEGIGRVSLARENEAGGSWGQKVHILHVNV